MNGTAKIPVSEGELFFVIALAFAGGLYSGEEPATLGGTIGVGVEGVIVAGLAWSVYRLVTALKRFAPECENE